MADYHTIDLPASADHDSGFDQVDGFVATWYDQSGNGNNATQPVATSQPKIVEAGVLLADGIKFDGVDDCLNNPTVIAQPFTSFSVYKATANNSAVHGSDDGGPEGAVVARRGNGEYMIYAGIALAGDTHPSSGVLASAVFDGAASTGRWNGVDILSGESGSATSINLIGGDGIYRMTGSIQEILIYDSDQSAVRTNIEFNINNAYSIY